MKKVISVLFTSVVASSLCVPGYSAEPTTMKVDALKGGMYSSQSEFVDQTQNTQVPNAEVHVPPQGFDPLTATPEELNFYNYPPRPSDVENFNKWKDAVTKEKWVAPKFEKGKLNHKKTVPQNGATYATFTNWDGVEVKQYSTEVVGYWTQPIAQSDSSHLPSYASQWVGLGGDGINTPLIQEGTSSVANADSSGSYPAWYEIVGTNKDTGTEVDITNLPHAVGDQYYGDVWFTTDSSGGVAHFYMSDQTQNTAVSYSVSGLTNYTGVTNTAEWILERPTVGNISTYYLSKVNNVPFTCLSGLVGSLSKPDPYASTTQYDKMIDSLGTQIAGETTLDYNGYFQATWLGYGNGH